MGLGTELPLLAGLGFVVLGPKKMHAIIRQLAEAKKRLESSSREIKSRLAAEMETGSGGDKEK